MGYYSDVRISTTNEGFDLIKKRQPETNCLIGGWDYVEDYKDENGVVFGWDTIKWYKTFPEVEAVMEALEEAEELGIPYEYLEVGEDGFNDSREYERQELWYHVEPVTRIEVWRS